MFYYRGGAMKIRLSHGATCPKKQTTGAAGYDLYALESVDIPPGVCVAVNTGVRLEIPPRHYGQIAGRSGLARDYGVISSGGIIDADYRGEVHVLLYKLSGEPFRVVRGMRVAQLLILPCASPILEVVQDLTETERGENGFGSSGLTD